MRRALTPLLLALLLGGGCVGNPDRRTLAGLHDVEPDLAEVQIESGLEQAMIAYRKYLEEVPESARTPEAMRRLADLKLEKEYGILGDGEYAEMPAPKAALPAPNSAAPVAASRPARNLAEAAAESQQDFEQRASAEAEIAGSQEDLALPGGEDVAWRGPLEAIELYDQILATYPDYPNNDQVLYQKARAYDELGRSDEAIAVMQGLIARYPHSRYIDEVQFRRAEYFFVRKRFLDAEDAYSAVTARGPGSDYFELALYKLGWTFYKQELHEEALEQYVSLLDYKVDTGYDFDQTENEADQRRIADTYRVISLSFSSLGGPQAVKAWFAARGTRSYEDRIYSQLGDFYLDKRRYSDAAASYETFVDLYPLHRASPHFSMRVVEIYEKGGFPKLVLESKKEFAASYSLDSPYWQHFDVNGSPEVLSYLKSNLTDLANHYHAVFQEKEEEKTENFQEASRWYRAFLSSFPSDEQAPGIHHRLADLLLEHEDFGEAAREYERTAYDYPAHEQAAAAGYAAIFAHRENLKVAPEAERTPVKREAVASTLRFVDTFPEDEHAATVLGAAVDDLYEMGDFAAAIATGQRLIDEYPDAELAIRRGAWAVVAHASFDIAEFVHAEAAYLRVLEMTAEDDAERQAVVDTLAASIYKQGEQAQAAEDHRAAADHFLRITQVAPTSEIRAAAEYDAGAALIHLEAWAEAASVLEAFRETHPQHELHREATKQLAFVRREEGNLSRAAEEYQRVAAEADEPELRREALLVAGELYEEAEALDRALGVYQDYVAQFPRPLEMAVETRFKVAELQQETGNESAHHEELRRIVEIERSAGDERTPRVRYLAARSALVLTEGLFHRFADVRLVQPFQDHLAKKQKRMNEALEGFGSLVDYEVGEVTAAATFYIAEIYSDFSQSLMESERPSGLDASALLDYEMVLEEEAFPFEEKAIEVHEKNLELMGAGVFNPWIQKSLDQLARLMPGRYAKFETSTGFIASIDRYAYRSPGAKSPGVEESELDADAGPEEPDASTDADSEGESAPDEDAGQAVGAA
ncbi:MAG: tetratricopeptide repeat protein [Myxococcota bacterium]|nr:tetratricopeptide repeat protein [Myxococcota bacterium]